MVLFLAAGCATSGSHAADPGMIADDVPSAAVPAAPDRPAHAAVRRVPAATQAAYDRGVVLAVAGELDAAREAFRSAVLLSPEFADAYRGLGVVLQELKSDDAALAAFGNAIRLRPDFAEAWVGLAEALNTVGRNEDALAAYREAVRLSPELAAPTRQLERWLIGAPRWHVDPAQRLRFQQFSIRPPAGGHWTIDGAWASASAAIFERTNIGKGPGHTAVAWVHAVAAPAGERDPAALLRRLEREWRSEIRGSTRLEPIDINFAVTRLGDIECAMQRFRVEDRDATGGEAFVIEGANLICPSLVADDVQIRLHYSQRHPAGHDALALDDEVMPMFVSLAFPL